MNWKIVVGIVIGVAASGALRSHYDWPRFPHGFLAGFAVTMGVWMILEPKLLKVFLGKTQEGGGDGPEDEQKEDSHE